MSCAPLRDCHLPYQRLTCPWAAPRRNTFAWGRRYKSIELARERRGEQGQASPDTTTWCCWRKGILFHCLVVCLSLLVKFNSVNCAHVSSGFNQFPIRPSSSLSNSRGAFSASKASGPTTTSLAPSCIEGSTLSPVCLRPLRQLFVFSIKQSQSPQHGIESGHGVIRNPSRSAALPSTLAYRMHAATGESTSSLLSASSCTRQAVRMALGSAWQPSLLP